MLVSFGRCIEMKGRRIKENLAVNSQINQLFLSMTTQDLKHDKAMRDSAINELSLACWMFALHYVLLILGRENSGKCDSIAQANR